MTRHLELLTPDWSDYQLLDSGNAKKLERFGEFTLIRPEPQAKWAPVLSPAHWEAANGEFTKTGTGRQGEWKLGKSLPKRWVLERNNLKFWLQPSPSGHVGVFPDQACHWDWLAELMKHACAPVKVLSLFGHTGLATLAVSATCAEVTHVDSSRKAVAWARENQALSRLSERPIRWIVEDALTFVRREGRRGNRYDAMIIDPPRFGRGPDGQIWKLDKALPELLSACASILSKSPAFLLLNVYVTVLSQARTEEEAESLCTYLQDMLKPFTMSIAAGELVIQDAAGRKIHSSIFARAQKMPPRLDRASKGELTPLPD
ncbi:MAG TPA: class I SAM-dependent methyltransferase [Candidatus Acidoferrum sp.]|nr:class I SAM-dependent methyltransferase [Candidatus Acidoferrum sp.]